MNNHILKFKIILLLTAAVQFKMSFKRSKLAHALAIGKAIDSWWFNGKLIQRNVCFRVYYRYIDIKSTTTNDTTQFQKSRTSRNGSGKY